MPPPLTIPQHPSFAAWLLNPIALAGALRREEGELRQSTSLQLLLDLLGHVEVPLNYRRSCLNERLELRVLRCTQCFRRRLEYLLMVRHLEIDVLLVPSLAFRRRVQRIRLLLRLR